MDYHKLSENYYGKWADSKIPKARQLDLAISDLWRSYPQRGATFSACGNEECDSTEGLGGRGGGLCSRCIVGCIGAINGSHELAENYHQAVLECLKIRDQLTQRV